MNLITTFNVRLAHIASLGYQHTVCFSLPTLPPKPPAGVPVISVDKERSAGSAIHQQRARTQVHRTNRLDPSEQQIRRRARERKRDQRRREATRLLKQAALLLVAES